MHSFGLSLVKYCITPLLLYIFFNFKANAENGQQAATAVFSRLYIAGVVITVVPEHGVESRGAQPLQIINVANNGDTAEEDEVIVNCH